MRARAAPPKDMPAVFNLYIFNRRGDCLYYREWDRKLNTLADDPSEERRLMFGARPRESTHTPRVLGRAEFARDRAPVGMLAATQELTRQFSPRKPSEGLQVIRTNTFTLHHLETLSGLRFVLNTDNDAGDLRPLLRHIYGSLWCARGALRPSSEPRPPHRPVARSAQGRTHRQIAALRSEGFGTRRVSAL